jgi:GNAT superfamily N-acetyltransferase
MNVIIRKATIQDIDTISVLFDNYRIFYKQVSDIASAKIFISERINNKESIIFVAEENKQVVGFTQLYPIFSSVSLSRTWLLNDLFVSEGSRGKGYADALLLAAQKHGAETNSKWLMLQTAIDNHAAQKVYERNGWKKDEDTFTFYKTINEPI